MENTEEYPRLRSEEEKKEDNFDQMQRLLQIAFMHARDKHLSQWKITMAQEKINFIRRRTYFHRLYSLFLSLFILDQTINRFSIEYGRSCNILLVMSKELPEVATEYAGVSTPIKKEKSMRTYNLSLPDHKERREEFIMTILDLVSSIIAPEQYQYSLTRKN